MPKWATPERQAQLIDLFHRLGNRCLQGHDRCPIFEHYIEYVPYAVHYPILNSDGSGYGVGISRVHIAKPNTLYEKIMGEVIRDWVADDAEGRAYERKLEAKRLHSFTDEHTFPLRGNFCAISRTIYNDSQPMFQILGLGVSGLTFKPFAKIRLASSDICLHVDISEALKPLSKCKRRKAIRYGKPLPHTIVEAVSASAALAIHDYLA